MRYKPEISRLSGMQLLALTIAVLFSSHTVFAEVGPNWIEQFGITWTFDKNLTTDGAGDTYQYGTFINGDYWVVGPVVIIGIDPPSREIDGHIMNGSMINPVAADDQAYDSLAAGYRAEKNVAFNVDAQNPLIVMAGSSLISSISLDTDTVARPQVNAAAVLTILAFVPPANSFRPPYSGSDKSIRAVKDDIDRTKLSNLPKPAGALSYPALVDRLQMNKGPWINHWDSWWEGYIHPIQNMPNYGRGIAERTGEAALALNLNYTKEEKEPILIDFLQLGIDLYGVIEAGDIFNWMNNGGHMHGRKIPILFAGIVLGHEGMRSIGEKSGDYLYVSVDENGYPSPTGPSNPPDDYIHFQEDDQTFYVAQYDYDVTHDLVGGEPWAPMTNGVWPKFPYRLTDKGMPEWGIRHATSPGMSARNINTNYRSLNAVTYPAMILAAHMMGMKEYWNHDALFDYTDRWVAWIWGDPPDPPENDEVDETQARYDALKKNPSSWVWNAWFDYRANYGPVWPNQSGNQRPIADAGQDQELTGTGSVLVDLDGSASTDNDGDIVSWVWTDSLGDPIPDGQVVSATLSVGEHIITLTVTDDAGASDTDTVAISIQNPFVNQPPIADAGQDQELTGTGSVLVDLDGSASTDNDGDIVSWVWTDSLGDPIPDGQVVSATLSVGEHIITLTVTDDAGASDTDTVAISIENSGEPADPDDGLVYSKTDASSFNGVDSFVQIPTSGMSVDGGTIALSAYAEDLSVSRYLFGHTVGSWSNRIQLYIRDGNLGLGLGDTNSRHTSIASIQTKRWYHIALSWNGTEYTVYVDGSESATGSYSGLTELNTFADIGNTGNPSFRDQEAFYGSIKDVRIYNRALTDTEIQQLYNNGSGDPTHSVTASAQTGGSITPNGTLQLAEGVDQTFTITPQTGYHIADVLVDGSSAGAVASYTFANITGDHTITATFSLDTYTIAATAQAGATVSPGGNIEVQHGSSRTFTITAQTGYHITDVIVNGQSMGVIGSYTFTNITQSHTLAANAAANPGPVAWWKLDTYSGLNSPDSSENDNTATLANGPSWTGAGELKLDGVDDYVDCGSGASLNLTGDLTVTAWVYPESFGGNGFGRIVDKGDAGSGFAFYVREGAGSIAYLTYGGDFVVSGSGVIDLAKWQHVAVTYSDASDTVTFYVNGLPAGGGNYQTNPNDSADQPLIIGNRAALDRGFDGMLSNVRIYSRTLAADEISAIYRTHEVAEARNLAFELSTADSDDYVVQEGNLPLPAGATFTDNIFTWRTWYNQAGNYEITFEVPGRPDLTQSVPMTVENVSLKPWYQDFLEANSKY